MLKSLSFYNPLRYSVRDSKGTPKEGAKQLLSNWEFSQVLLLNLDEALLQKSRIAICIKIFVKCSRLIFKLNFLNYRSQQLHKNLSFPSL